MLVFGGLGFVLTKYQQSITALLFPPEFDYIADTEQFRGDTEFESVEWQNLIPDEERQLFEKYQTSNKASLGALQDRFLKTLQAANDDAYQSALVSMNTVSELNGRAVVISGFIVPIDFHDNQDPHSLFIVPYFGACIHFPPPPPNQMLFAQIQEGFSQFDLNQAYTLEGVIETGLFEDPMGTAAYILRVKSIRKYYGQPDTFRDHG